ncbi:MAG: hypothetical protein PVF68_09690 [Acidobacteriota bacterium]|jgi:HEAT repeat protein
MVGKDLEGRRGRGICWTAFLLAGVALAAPQAGGKAAAPTAKDVLTALQHYDDATASSGPSAERLAEAARLDLHYCLAEGRGWDGLEAARVLARDGDPEGIAALRKALGAGPSQLRVTAARYLAEAGVREARPDIRALAEDASVGEYGRLQAALALRELGEGALAAALGTKLCGSERHGVRYLAVESLVSSGDADALPTLKGLLEGTSEDIAYLAAEGVARLGDPAGKERLLQGLAAPNRGMRLLASWHLLQLGDDAPAEVLRPLVEEGLEKFPDFKELDFDPAVAAYLLVRIAPGGAEPFVKRIRDLDWTMGHLLVGKAYAELRSPRAMPILSAVMDEEPDLPTMAPLRIDALNYAEWTGDSPALRALAAGAAVPEELSTVRLPALALMARLGMGDEALPGLRGFLGDANLLYRTRAAEAVLRFGEGPEPPEPSGPPEGLP